MVFIFCYIKPNLIVESIITPDKIGNTNFRILPDAEGLVFIEDLSNEIQKGIKENNLITVLFGLPVLRDYTKFNLYIKNQNFLKTQTEGVDVEFSPLICYVGGSVLNSVSPGGLEKVVEGIYLVDALENFYCDPVVISMHSDKDFPGRNWIRVEGNISQKFIFSPTTSSLIMMYLIVLFAWVGILSLLKKCMSLYVLDGKQINFREKNIWKILIRKLLGFL